MSEAHLSTLIVFLALVCVKGNVVQWENNLQPVQSLYVKPSVDGTTGDLYVAASEDSGSSAQWVADQPINFLSKPTFSASVTTSTSPHEQTITSQKSAVFTSNPVKYSNVPTPYPYAPVGQAPFDYTAYDYSRMPYLPYNYLYPYIMSAAAATAAHALKEAGLSEEMANAVLSHSSTLWQPQTGYPYHVGTPQYAVDRNAWTSQPAASPVPAVANQQNTDQPSTST